MKQLLIAFMIGVALIGTSTALAAAPPSHRAGTKPNLKAQVKDSEATITAARTRNAALQAQVSQLEQQNAARAQQLQQRDAEIAALQQKLRAAGVPASAASAGHHP